MNRHDADDGPFLTLARRYEPVVVSVVVILVALLVAPRVTREHATEFDALSSPAIDVSVDIPPSSTLPTIPEAAFDFAAGMFPPIIPSESPYVVPTVDSPGPSTTTTTTAPIEPVALRVAEAGWSGSDGGLPIAGADVPDGALPVSSRVGEPDRRTYLRLAGTSTVLTLGVTTDPVGSRFTEDAVIWLCPITASGWHGAEGMTAADAPAYDCTTHSVGRAEPEQWTFDLSVVGDPSRANGFALVAAPGASDFQILFEGPSAG